MQAVPRFCEFYPAICLTTEEEARKNLSQGKKNLSQVKKNLSQSAVFYWYFSDDKTEPDKTDENYDWLRKVRAVLDWLIDSYPKYCSLAEHLQLMKSLCSSKVQSSSDSIYQRHTSCFG